MSKNYLLKLKKKKIALLGLGVENQALIKYLADKEVRAEITVCDARNNPEIEKKCEELAGQNKNLVINRRLGPDYDKNLADYDIVFRSPGYPLASPELQKVSAANADVDRRRKTAVTSPIRFFFRVCPTKNIIGVTGTKGKGTTASLIRAILEAAGKRVFLGGNIGVAPLSFIDQLGKSDWVILELSSFQLEDLDMSPKIAVFTNFFPDHLAPADPLNPNYHHSLADYWRAKGNILGWQKKGDAAVINRRLEHKKFAFGFGRRVFFGESDMPSLLPGAHNRENAGAAVAVAGLLKIRKRTIARAVREFKGLTHRLEGAGEIDGVRYFNDSFATTPESVVLALDSFAAPVILIAGGADKGADFKKMALAVKRKAKFIILFPGPGSSRIKTALLATGYPANKTKEANGMAMAVKQARHSAESGDIILLSPGCASFGLFTNYKERGNMFKLAVAAIKQNKNKANTALFFGTKIS